MNRAQSARLTAGGLCTCKDRAGRKRRQRQERREKCENRCLRRARLLLQCFSSHSRRCKGRFALMVSVSGEVAAALTQAEDSKLERAQWVGLVCAGLACGLWSFRAWGEPFQMHFHVSQPKQLKTCR